MLRAGYIGRYFALFSTLAFGQQPNEEVCLAASITITEKSGLFGVAFLDSLSSGDSISFRFSARIIRVVVYPDWRAILEGVPETRTIKLGTVELTSATLQVGSNSITSTLPSGTGAGFFWDYNEAAAAAEPNRQTYDQLYISSAIRNDSDRVVLTSELHLAGSHRLLQSANPLAASAATSDATLDRLTLSGGSLAPSGPSPNGKITGRITSLEGRSGGCSVTQAPLCSIRSVSFVKRDGTTPLDGSDQHDRNPMEALGDQQVHRLGGGLRIFAEKPGSELNVQDTVKIVVHTNSPDTSIQIHLKSYDIDDPSFDEIIDPNGASGSDNYGNPDKKNPGLFVDTGTPEYRKDLKTDDTGKTPAVELRLTHQPGDNFVVAAACPNNQLPSEPPSLEQLEQLKKQGPGPVAWSATLTVWRTLHLEVDSMKPVEDHNSWRGTVIESWLARSLSGGAITYVRLDMADSSLRDDGRFDWGRMLFVDLGKSAPILSNEENRFVLDGEFPPVSIQGQNVLIYDDDDVNGRGILDGDKNQPLGKPDVSLLAPAFAAAYVLPVEDLPNPTPEVPFVLNTPAPPRPQKIPDYDPEFSKALQEAYRFDNAKYEADLAFWTVYIVAGYQGPLDMDCDSHTDRTCLGAAADNPSPGYAGQGVTLFREAHREKWALDRYDPLFNESATVLHEVGHLFEGQHIDGGIMGSNTSLSATAPRTSLLFTPISIKKIRSAPHP